MLPVPCRTAGLLAHISSRSLATSCYFGTRHFSSRGAYRSLSIYLYRHLLHWFPVAPGMTSSNIPQMQSLTASYQAVTHPSRSMYCALSSRVRMTRVMKGIFVALASWPDGKNKIPSSSAFHAKMGPPAQCYCRVSEVQPAKDGVTI